VSEISPITQPMTIPHNAHTQVQPKLPVKEIMTVLPKTGELQITTYTYNRHGELDMSVARVYKLNILV
jgi:hypothetical protein